VSLTTYTVQVTGGNLFQLAAKTLGDATQFIHLMQHNGLSDPQLQGLVTLEIPTTPDPVSAGGLPTMLP
jgi:hypothetical protein